MELLQRAGQRPQTKSANTQDSCNQEADDHDDDPADDYGNDGVAGVEVQGLAHGHHTANQGPDCTH